MLEMWQFWVALVVAFIIGFVLAIRCSRTEEKGSTENDRGERESRRTTKDVRGRDNVSASRSSRDAVVDVTRSLTEVDDYTPLIPPAVLQRKDVSVHDTVEHESHKKEYIPKIPRVVSDPNHRPDSMKKPSEPRSKGEVACKQALERIYSPYTFHSTWPNWLRNPETGCVLELDLYNEELGIAVEFHGKQHYVYTPHFHRKGISDFQSQVRRDHYKIDLCDQNGVWLIVVPYNTPEDKIENYIRYYSPENVERRERASKFATR